MNIFFNEAIQILRAKNKGPSISVVELIMLHARRIRMKMK